ncbi:MAG: hypothetical protein MJ052_02140 [Sphaerochaetaceae bacterium]|nr:hypothetical protein [Sphaerochaetaceae bacterium]
MRVKRQTLFIVGAVLLLVGIAVLMVIIGRGHIVYVDNKTVEYNGNEYKAYNLVELSAKGNDPQEAFARDRILFKCVGQSLKIEYEATKKQSSSPEKGIINKKIPFSWDAVVVNLPAYFAGLPEEVWFTEFIQEPPADKSSSNEEIVFDEFTAF